MKCPYCGQDHAVEALFCPNTGQKIETAAYCMSCGARLEAGQKACGVCGVPVGEVEGGETQPAPRRRRFTCATAFLVLLITLASCLILSAIVLFVDPLGLHIPGRLLGRYDAAAESMPAETDLYLGINLLNARPNSLERMAPLVLPFGFLIGRDTQLSLIEGARGQGSNGAFGQVLDGIEEETGVRIPDDLTPWIGQYIGAGVVGLGVVEGDNPGFVLAIEARSRGAADRFLAKLEDDLADRQDMQFDEVNYHGARFKVVDARQGQEAIAFGRAGNMVLFASSEDAIKEAIDAQSKKSLADQAAYKRLVQSAPCNSLVRLYLPGEWIKDLIAESGAGSFDILPINAMLFYDAWTGSLLSAGSTSAGLQVDLLNLYDPGELSSKEKQSLKSSAPNYPSIKYLPDTTLVYISGTQFDQAAQTTIDAIANFSGGRTTSLTDEFPTTIMGVDLGKDILSKLDGDWVVAVAPSKDSVWAQQGTFDFGLIGLFGTSDETELTGAMEKIYDNFRVLGNIDESRSDDGVIYQISDDDSNSLIFYGVYRGYFLLGTGSDLLDETISRSRQLIDSEGYQRISRAFSGGTTPLFYADVQGLLDEMRQTLSDTEINSFEGMAGILKDVQYLAAGQKLIGDDIVSTRIIIISAK